MPASSSCKESDMDGYASWCDPCALAVHAGHTTASPSTEIHPETTASRTYRFMAVSPMLRLCVGAVASTPAVLRRQALGLQSVCSDLLNSLLLALWTALSAL